MFHQLWYKSASQNQQSTTTLPTMSLQNIPEIDVIEEKHKEYAQKMAYLS